MPNCGRKKTRETTGRVSTLEHWLLNQPINIFDGEIMLRVYLSKVNRIYFNYINVFSKLYFVVLAQPD